MPAVHKTEVRDSIDRAMAYEAAEREKFERWAKANTQLKLDRDLASYLSGTTQFAWMAWIERAALGVPAPPEPEPRIAFCPACFVEVTPEQADAQITAARVLAEFAQTAPGRLPQRVQDAIAIVTAGVKGLEQ